MARNTKIATDKGADTEAELTKPHASKGWLPHDLESTKLRLVSTLLDQCQQYSFPRSGLTVFTGPWQLAPLRPGEPEDDSVDFPKQSLCTSFAAEHAGRSFDENQS
jgi:hypothetical protein